MQSIPTATDIPILVPWRTDNGQRQRIWDLLREHVWQGWNVIEGDCDEGPFNRSQCLNRASDAAGDWEYAVIADADSFVAPGQLHGAIETAKRTGQVTIAHCRWIDVHPDEVMQVLTEGWVEWRDHRQIWEHTLSSMLVVPRTAWDAVNGFDERFKGWGREDNAFIRAIKVLHGEPARIDGTVWHLAHDRPYEDVNRALSPLWAHNDQHWMTYRSAQSAEQMRALVEGNRACPTQSASSPTHAVTTERTS